MEVKTFRLEDLEVRDSGDPARRHEATARARIALDPDDWYGLRKPSDLRLLVNQEPAARADNGTLELHGDGSGIRFFAVLDKHSDAARALRDAETAGEQPVLVLTVAENGDGATDLRGLSVMTEDTKAETPLALTGRRYRQVLRTVAATPWAIMPGTLAAIVDLVHLRASGERFTEDEVRERIGAGPARRNAERKGSIAVLPLYGVIAPKATLMSDVSGGTSLDRFRAAFSQLLADPSVDQILIDVDSPGGSVELVPEMAADLRAARGKKPMVAIANTLMASAAYHIASQADEIVITPSGELGSIGVFCAHDDISGMLAQMGVKTTLISAGKDKTLGNPFEPLTAEGAAMLQATVDEFYKMMTADIAKGRNVAVATVRGGFGEGRIVTANEAVRLGMADRVDTFDATVNRMLQRGVASGRSSMAVGAGGGDSSRESWTAFAGGPDADTVGPDSIPDVDELDPEFTAVEPVDPAGGIAPSHAPAGVGDEATARLSAGTLDELKRQSAAITAAERQRKLGLERAKYRLTHTERTEP